jgi:hypothetical protein
MRRAVTAGIGSIIAVLAACGTTPPGDGPEPSGRSVRLCVTNNYHGYGAIVVRLDGHRVLTVFPGQRECVEIREPRPSYSVNARADAYHYKSETLTPGGSDCWHWEVTVGYSFPVPCR